MYENASFCSPAFFRISTDSTILPLYRKKAGQQKPLFSHILHSDNYGLSDWNLSGDKVN